MVDLESKDEASGWRGNWRFPHMCQDGHARIGHATDEERCPVCLHGDLLAHALEGAVEAIEALVGQQAAPDDSYEPALKAAREAVTAWRERG